MDEKIEKAFVVANFMATLSNQKRIILEEYQQKLIHYVNGATFSVDHQLISFLRSAIELGYKKNLTIVDNNNFPVLIEDVQVFLEEVSKKYFNATEEYGLKYNDLRSKRKISDIVGL